MKRQVVLCIGGSKGGGVRRLYVAGECVARKRYKYAMKDALEVTLNTLRAAGIEPVITTGFDWLDL